jgi:hypothetical protein
MLWKYGEGASKGRNNVDASFGETMPSHFLRSAHWRNAHHHSSSGFPCIARGVLFRVTPLHGASIYSNNWTLSLHNSVPQVVETSIYLRALVGGWKMK